MLLNWQVPRYHAPNSLELFIDNALKTMSTVVSDPICNTRFEYWLLDPAGQVGTFFFSIMLAALIWLIVLQHASRRDIFARRRPHIEATAARTAGHKRDSTPEKHEDVLARMLREEKGEKKMIERKDDGENDDGHDQGNGEAIHSFDSIASVHALGSSVISRLAPPGHRPVNANLNVSPYRVVNHFAAPTSFSTPAVPLQSLVTPRELSAEPKSDEEDSTYSREERRSFSSLAIDAPVSYLTLRQRGWLEEDGTPSKKWVDERRLREVLK